MSQITTFARRTSPAVTAGRWLIVGVALAAAGTVTAQDWPQWRFDANRSAASDAPGPASGKLLWRLPLGRPDPAYDHQYRMCADVTYAPVAAEGLVFIPSNVSDQVLACDLETGAVRWRAVAEGPVRLAPLYYQGRVYFGSDDGYLYCVAAASGQRLWKVRGVPDALPDSRLLVNGRLCSRWPLRGAPVEYRGVIYCGAGIWPEEGVYVSAIDARDGRRLWCDDSLSYLHQGMSDHGRAYDLSLPPQGYLAVIDGRLAVPSGRSLAAWFDPQRGGLEPYTCYYVKNSPPRGTWCLSGIGAYWVQGGNWFGTRPDAAGPVPAELAGARTAVVVSSAETDNERQAAQQRPFLAADTYRLHDENRYTQPVLTASTLYQSEFTDEDKYLVSRGHTRVGPCAYDRIVARDLTHPRWTKTPLPRVVGGRNGQALRLEFPVLWELASPLEVLIKAGPYLYAGGQDTIAAIAIPEAGHEPRIAWQAPVEGTPVEALVADGKLVVVTDTGNVYGFGSGHESSELADHVSGNSVELLTSPAAGYACLLGWSSVAAARSLAEQDYRVVILEPDPVRAGAAREALCQAGLYGRRVQVVQARVGQTQLAPYWANVVRAEGPLPLEPVEPALAAALDLLRPYGGQLVWNSAGPQAAMLERLLAGRGDYALRRDGPDLVVRRTAPPPGADDWTHESGGPGNCYANAENLVRWPLGVLWYSGDVDRFFTPPSHFQHERQPFPLVAGGRMFLLTGQYLHAVDIYTGSYLWKAEMPLTPWLQTLWLDSRYYGRATERHCAAAADRVYVVTGPTIQSFDAATGRAGLAFTIPPQLEPHSDLYAPREERSQGERATIQAAPQWTEVRLWRELLLAMLGPNLAAFDRHDGRLLWTRPSTQQTTTFALDDQALYGLDCDLPGLGSDGRRESPQGQLFALDPQTGRVAWHESVQYASAPKQGGDHIRPWLRPVEPMLAVNRKHGLIVMAVNGNSLQVFRTADGTPAWSKPLPAGKDVEHVYPPVVTDDYLLLSDYHNCFGFLLDVRTGHDVGPNTGIPHPRTCARVIGNNHLLVYRDAATELYDVAGNRMIGLNSVRSGCTTSFIPAGGIMTAPMLGHGCVCNYPMFASLALAHLPELESCRPARVTESWANQAEALLSAGGRSASPLDDAEPAADASRAKIDVSAFRLIDCTLEPSGPGLTLTTAQGRAGYAVRTLPEPRRQATFTLALKRAGGEHRNGNGFFVFGWGNRPADWVQCQLYYGGRGAMTLCGPRVETVEAKLPKARSGTIDVTVRVDCDSGRIVLQSAGQELTAPISGPAQPITHYGYGGKDSSNLFTEIEVR